MNCGMIEMRTKFLFCKFSTLKFWFDRVKFVYIFLSPLINDLDTKTVLLLQSGKSRRASKVYVPSHAMPIQS